MLTPRFFVASVLSGLLLVPATACHFDTSSLTFADVAEGNGGASKTGAAGKKATGGAGSEGGTSSGGAAGQASMGEAGKSSGLAGAGGQGPSGGQGGGNVADGGQGGSDTANGGAGGSAESGGNGGMAGAAGSSTINISTACRNCLDSTNKCAQERKTCKLDTTANGCLKCLEGTGVPAETCRGNPAFLNVFGCGCQMGVCGRQAECRSTCVELTK